MINIKSKIILTVLILFVFISLTGVSAADNQTDEITTLNNNINTNEILTDTTYSLSDLAYDIQNKPAEYTYTLDKDYICNPERDSFEIEDGGIRIDKDNYVLDGGGHTIDGAGKTRIIKVTGNNVTLKNIKFIRGYTTNEGSEGGAIKFDPNNPNKNIIIDNCTFIDNTATSHGGAVYLNGHANIINSEFINNTAENYGGAVCFNNNLNIIGSNFINNTANANGGALSSADSQSNLGNVYVINSTFINNSADNGGAINMENILINVFKVKVINSNFTGNTAHSKGGAIHSTGEMLLFVIDSSFENNTATEKANAIYDEGYFYSLGNKFGENQDIIANTNKGTFTDLAEKISNAQSQLNLTYDFTFFEELDDAFINGIVIANPISINGNGYTISGINLARIFNVTSSSVSFKNLTFRDAKADDGAAIYFSHEGTVENCTFTNNTASERGGAVYFMFNGIVTNCIFTDNTATTLSGGAVYFYRNGEVINSIFTNNSAMYGSGAVGFRFNGIVTNCIFTDNSAEGSGGGAIEMSTGTVTNCNFINNTASNGNGGALYSDAQGADVINCTFTDNSAKDGGAIYMASDNGNVTNSYFANNKATVGAGAIQTMHSVTVDTCIFKTLSDTTYNTINHPPTLNVDNYKTLYGSGDKLTFDLKTNSNIPVTNGNISISVYFKNNDSWVGNYSCLSGEGWIPDLPVGSYYAIFNTEYKGFQPIKRTITITPKNTFSMLNYTINSNNNQMINLTNDFYFDSDYDNDFVNGIMINRPVTVNGNGHTINANGVARIFMVNSNDVVLENITFVNGSTKEKGGAVYFSSLGIIENCNFINNKATGIYAYGGAVYFDKNGAVTNCNFANNNATGEHDYGGALYFNGLGTVTNCNFVNNAVIDWNGGAVYFNSNCTVTNCTFTDNSARHGGAVNFNKNATVTNCNFVNNTASYNGGALYFENNCTVTNCTFTNNSAKNDAGVIYCKGKGYVTNCTFTNNSAKNDAGVIYCKGKGYVTNCNFVNNTASYNGGAVYFENNCTLTNCIFTNNAASGDGGAVNFDKKGTVTNCIFTNNTANTNGGAIHFNETGAVTNCNFVNNTASNNGGALSFLSTCEMTNSSFTNNKADNGGAIVLNGGIINNSNFTGNNAQSGGAISNSGNLTISNSTFKDNTAADTTNNILLIGDAELHLVNVTPENFGPIYKGNMEVINVTNITYGDTAKITVKVTDAESNPVNSGTVSVIINGKEYSANVTNGTATIEMIDMDAGSYDVNVTYNGAYAASPKNVKFSVAKQNATIIASAKSYVINYDGKYTVTLKDAEGRLITGQKVTFTLNGKDIGSAVSDVNGVATITLTAKILKAAKAGSKNLVVKFTNSNYNPVSKSVKITVNKEKIKITAKKKTFKKSVKVKKYTIILKNSKGKAVKNVKVTLKIKGKTYKAKTNSKGKAIFKIKKLTKKGTFKAKVNFKATSLYLKSAKNVKIRIK